MQTISRAAVAILLSAFNAHALAAQGPADNPAMRAALAALKSDNAWNDAPAAFHLRDRLPSLQGGRAWRRDETPL